MDNTVKEKIAKILSLSQQFQPLMGNDENVVQALNKLNKDLLTEIKEKLLNNTNQEKINKIRLQVVNCLIEDGSIDENKIKAIKSSVKAEHKGNIVQAWKRYFKLLLPFFYIEKIREDLEEIAAEIIKSLALNGFVKCKVVDFDGASNFGSDSAWIAIYNKKQPSQRVCWQLFIGFEGETIKYGLLQNLDKGPDREAKLKKININIFDYNQMISYLDESKNTIIEDDKPIKYWKFSPGTAACFWPEMQNEKIASIGCGDYPFEGKNKSAITNLDPSYFTSHKDELDSIQAFNQAQIGDIIFAFEGRKKVIGYGVIKATSKYSEKELIAESKHHNYLGVDWIKLDQPTNMKNVVSMNDFSDITERRMELDKIMVSIEDSTSNENTEEDIDQASVNQILYGPPGTGKTYLTVVEALKILEGTNYDPNMDYSDQKKLYDGYRAKGQIEFVTFHQSFSYEDFVEGIRAETNNRGNISYSVKDGVFKKLAIEALFNKYEAENLPDEKAINDSWLTVKDNQQKEMEFDAQNYEHKKLLLSTPNRPAFVERTGKPYVLIIDEINRGNTSRIFGELITLIESTKRAGSDEAMDAVLPYSQETFTVPDNLYIIGTMNTADRSLALIDTALRRRFDFIEMMPNATKIENDKRERLIIDDIDIQDMLVAINDRIEALYDREHTIGHAFFMKLKDKPTINELASIFRNKILPLLEEYFFEDWEKITQVLGKSDIYKDETLTEIQLGFKPSGKNYSRNDDKLAKAQTYINIYSTDPVQQD